MHSNKQGEVKTRTRKQGAEAEFGGLEKKGALCSREAEKQRLQRKSCVSFLLYTCYVVGKCVRLTRLVTGESFFAASRDCS